MHLSVFRIILLWDQSYNTRIDTSQVNVLTIKIFEQSDKALFNSAPTFFNEKALEAIRTWGMIIW